MTTKHTPGPWVISERVKTARLDNALMVRPADHHNYEYGATAIIATSEASARLISAAPDLLAALKSLMARAAQDAEDYAPDGNEPIWGCIADASDAIQKATGEKI